MFLFPSTIMTARIYEAYTAVGRLDANKTPACDEWMVAGQECADDFDLASVPVLSYGGVFLAGSHA